MSAAVKLHDGTRMEFDSLPNSKRIVISFETQTPGSVQLVKLISERDLPAVIATLQLLQKQLAA